VTITYLTQDGYNKLKGKLDHLVKVERKEIAKALEHARSFGDISENAEYETAKESQRMNEIRIAELTAKLSSARIVSTEDIASDKVYIGATVSLQDMKTNETLSYTLVSEDEADILENKISVSSPVGKGLLGKAENEVAEITVPSGVLVYKIVKITR